MRIVPGLILTSTLALTVLVSTHQAGAAGITCEPVGKCGDVDSSGVVAAGDALRVLKKAVGQAVSLTCECSQEDGSCSAELAECKGNLTISGNALTSCTTSSNICTNSLNTCTSSLNTRTLELATSDANLSTCQTTLGSTQSALETCDGSLGTCSGNLGICNGSLVTCNGSLSTCNVNLGTCNSSLSTTNAALTTCHGDLATCEALPLSQPVTTNQITCYSGANTVIGCAGTAQDGQYHAGASHDFTDNNDGTITDGATGLMWEKLSNDGSLHDKDSTYDWYDAISVKVAGLNADVYAGHSDWRLPNRNELQTLVNLGTVLPAAYPEFNTTCALACTVFTCSCTASNAYWSSTTVFGTPNFAWNVIMSDGGGSPSGSAKIGANRVRVVRGGV